ncbi:unnamed protein product [Orchesella dallaii]|uniref:C2H2-type domain-containing protein n=1 Tax=Orchesella dallaii TaxID=48710 RepID=A0ABP1SB09_9HEXA
MFYLWTFMQLDVFVWTFFPNTFNMNGNLKQHIRAVHQPGKFTCHHCPTSMVFTTNKYLRAHIRKYHPQHFIAGKPRNPDNLSSTEKQKAEGEGETIGMVQVRTVNWKVTLPNVLLNSGCGEAQTSGSLNGESSIEDNLEIARRDPIARDATHDNSFILPQDEPISIERQNNEGEAIGTVTELIDNENDDDEIVELPSSGLSELGVIPVGEEVVSCINGMLHSGRRCPDCSKILNDEKQYQKHYRHQHLSFKCSCGIRFQTQKIAHNHFKRHHQRAIEERHGCVYCGMVYDTPRKLRRHIREIHMHKRAHCPHCDASFQTKSNMAQHIRAVHRSPAWQIPLSSLHTINTNDFHCLQVFACSHSKTASAEVLSRGKASK